MGNYIYSGGDGVVKMKPQNKFMIKTLKKKLTLLKVIDAMKIYVDCCLPEVKLS